MTITVLGFNITAQDKTQILRMLSAAGIKETINIQDTRSTLVNLVGTDVVVVLGKRALIAVRPIVEARKTPLIELPEVSKLYPPDQGGDTAARDGAWEKLKTLKSNLSTGKLEISEDEAILKGLVEDQIPNLSLSKLQALEKALKDSKKTTWKCTTKSGKIVCISLQPLEVSSKSVDADIYITFHELFALRAAMDIFQISEVTFVSNSSNQGSSENAGNSTNRGASDSGNQVPG